MPPLSWREPDNHVDLHPLPLDRAMQLIELIALEDMRKHRQGAPLLGIRRRVRLVKA
jgi:hypothetical protein